MSDWSAETAEWYAQKFGEYPTNRLSAERLPLPEAGLIVDIGCGTASALRTLVKRQRGLELVGVDPIPRMVEIARARVQAAEVPIEIVCAPAHGLPLPDDSAGLVFALDSFDHWKPHQAEGLRQVRRILRPGCWFVVCKDGELPYTPEEALRFELQVCEAGFTLDRSEHIEDEVCFRLWWFK